MARREFESFSQPNFTFFPQPSEQKMIAGASARQMADYLQNQPGLTIPFLHELWRTQMLSKVHEITQIYPQILENATHPASFNTVVRMHVLHFVPTTTCETFLRDTFIAMANACDNLPLNNRLNEVDLNRINSAVALVRNKMDRRRAVVSKLS